MDECAQRRRGLAAEFQQYRQVFLALGNETRQQIFLALLENETIGMRVPELMERTHLSRPTVSLQLRALKDAGLVAVHRAGTRNYYYVNAEQSCWNGLQVLFGHVSTVAARAGAVGYPRLMENEPPAAAQCGKGGTEI